MIKKYKCDNKTFNTFLDLNTYLFDTYKLKIQYSEDLSKKVRLDFSTNPPTPINLGITVETVEEQNTPEQLRDIVQLERDNLIRQLVVTVDGMEFQGSRQAQANMSQVITQAIANGDDLDNTKVQWVLKDNTLKEVSIRQLAKALKLATEETTKLYVQGEAKASSEIQNLDMVGKGPSLAKVGV